MLKELVEANRRINRLNAEIRATVSAVESSDVVLCDQYYPTNEFNVYSGIEKLAEEAGVELETVERNSDLYRYQKQFYFDGIKFFHLEKDV